MVEFLDNRETAYDPFIGRWTFRLFIFLGVKYKPHYVKENLQWKHFEKIPPPPLFGESQKNHSFWWQEACLSLHRILSAVYLCEWMNDVRTCNYFVQSGQNVWETLLHIYIKCIHEVSQINLSALIKQTYKCCVYTFCKKIFQQNINICLFLPLGKKA